MAIRWRVGATIAPLIPRFELFGLPRTRALSVDFLLSCALDVRRYDHNFKFDNASLGTNNSNLATIQYP